VSKGAARRGTGMVGMAGHGVVGQVGQGSVRHDHKRIFTQNAPRQRLRNCAIKIMEYKRSDQREKPTAL
jgi:hypothetical protein